MKISRMLLVFGALLSLAGCGGGGGGDSSSTPPPPPPPPPAPSALSYSSSPAVAVVGQAAGPFNPTVTGTVTSYSISAALPAGMTINSTTGVISGTPTSASAWGDYLVTASNAT